MRAGMRLEAERGIGPAAIAQGGDADLTGEPCDGASLGTVLHLHELLPVVRERLRLGSHLTDEAVLASLAAITSRSVPRERWKVAFNSALGRFLATRGSDLASALGLLMALLPPPRS